MFLLLLFCCLSAIRFDKDEDKKKLGVMHPGPGKYEMKSLSFQDNSQQAVLQEIAKQKKKMKLLNGLDLDNNGIDDGLEIEALLPVSGEGVVCRATSGCWSRRVSHFVFFLFLCFSVEYTFCGIHLLWDIPVDLVE